MGSIGTLFTAFSAVAGLAGSAMAAQGSIAAGQAQHQQAVAAAEQQRFQAKQVEARGKWEMAQKRQKADLARDAKERAQSKFQNIASSSGFMFGDHSSVKGMENLERYGSFDEFNEMAGGKMARWDATNQKNAHMYQASLHEMEGQAALTGSRQAARGTLIGGVGSMLGTLGGLAGQGGGRTQVASARGSSGGSSASRSVARSPFFFSYN